MTVTNFIDPTDNQIKKLISKTKRKIRDLEIVSSGMLFWKTMSISSPGKTRLKSMYALFFLDKIVITEGFWFII